MKSYIRVFTLLFASMSVCGSAFADTTSLHQCPQLEVGFSPEGGAESLVLKAIDSSKSTVRVLAYSFTSKAIVQALLNARKRGVDVAVVADSSNVKSRAGIAALSALSNAGGQVRIIEIYKIQHEKILIVDSRTVEFGSFNFSKAAAEQNSEDVNVCWNSSSLASVYNTHWKSRWEQATAFAPRY